MNHLSMRRCFCSFACLSLLKTRSSVHECRSNARRQAEILSSIGSAGCQLKVRPASDTCRADLFPETVASLTTQQMLCRDPVVSMMKTTDLRDGHDSARG